MRFISRTLRSWPPSGASTADAAGFRVESQRRGGVVHVALFGDVDFSARERLTEVLLASVMAPTTEVCVDLGDARFLDCSGIGTLVAGRHAALTAGCQFRVVGAQGKAARVLDITGAGAFLGGEDGIRGMPRWRRRPAGSRTRPVTARSGTPAVGADA